MMMMMMMMKKKKKKVITLRSHECGINEENTDI